MLDWNRNFHTGIIVDDIEQARTHYSNTLGLGWTEVRAFDPLPFWTPERGSHEVTVHACYSKFGPNHFELCQGTGEFYSTSKAPEARHNGVWVDDLPAEANALIAEGWKVLAAGASPDEGFGVICYMEPPMGGLVVELVSTDLKPVIDEWLATAP